VTTPLPPFQTLLDEHGADLHRFLVASVGRHDGDDCFQETIVSALRAYPDLRDPSNLRGWLFTIAYRKIVDRARVADRHGAPTSKLLDRPHVDGHCDPELWSAVRALPPKQRAAIVERFVFDRPYAEIAELIECSEDAARQNVRAGLARLREVVTP
jgi:RNA polymerase sigma factor (sigma-70 family)